MKTQADIRETLDKAIKNSKYTYRSLSLMIGKAESYIQRYVKMGLPSKLPELERRQIAEILGIDEQELTDLPLHRIETTRIINQAINHYPEVAKIEILDVTACCGNGVENETEKMIGEWAMPLQDFRQITFTEPDNVKMLKVVGDSMTPTLKAGDWVLVDISQQTPDVDGMYLIRMATGLAVKRLQIGLSDIKVVSDNKSKYEPITASTGEIKVIGRVIYTLNAERVG